MSSRGLARAPPAKTVVLCRNGDPFFPGRKLVVNQRRLPTWEAFLNEVTQSIRAPLAVRSLHTPRHGRRVTELGDLQDGCLYVAAGFEKFRKLKYLTPGRKELGGTRNSRGLQLGLQLQAAAPRRPKVPARQTHTHLPCTIHVFRNGDLLSPPFPLLLPRSTLLQWDALLATLTEKAALSSGAVCRLCRLDGTPVSGGEELGNGRYYVAVGNEEYKNLPYCELLVPQDSACRNLCRRVQTRRAAEKDRIPAAFPQLQRQARKSHPQEAGSLFQAKPIRAGWNRRSNMQQRPDEEGVYKSRGVRKEMRGAQEIKEEELPRVDKAMGQAQTAATSQGAAARRRDTQDSEDEEH